MIIKFQLMFINLYNCLIDYQSMLSYVKVKKTINYSLINYKCFNDGYYKVFPTTHRHLKCVTRCHEPKPTEFTHLFMIFFFNMLSNK